MKTLLAILMLLVLTSPVLGAGTKSVNFVRYTETIRNGILTDAVLVFFPETFGEKDQDFKTYEVTGHADAFPRVPIESAAKHNAISRLLVTHGLKYLEGKQLLRDKNYSDTIIIIYEGFVTIPSVVKSYRYLDDGKTLEGVFNLIFCPAKRPGKSIFQHIRQRVTYIGDTVAFFLRNPFCLDTSIRF
jgi:hypothetical protein